MLFRKSTSQQPDGLETIIYTEPQISARSTSTTQAGDNLLNMKTNESDQETDWIISSKVQTLGDFIDTDAVSSPYFLPKYNGTNSH